MTSIEDWSLWTLSSQIFRQQTQLQLRSGNSRFFGGRPSWKATGLQLQSGNSRFFGGRSCCNATGLQLQSANSWFFWWQTKATAATAIWELEFWVAGLVGKWATTAIWVLAVFFGGWAGLVRLQCETWVFLAAGT